MRSPLDPETNRTGTFPSMKRMSDTVEPGAPQSPPLRAHQIADARACYAAEAAPIGSVPDAAALEGPVRSTTRNIDKRSIMLIDLLGERLAYERTATRLYEGLLSKLRSEAIGLPKVSIDELQVFRDQEAEHFNLVADAMDRLGADPTAQTPSADVTGIASLGLLQAVDDPRTTPTQCLEVLLTAELTDQAGWELLIELAQAVGEDDLAIDFGRALEEEKHHLRMIQRWHDEAILNDPQ